nr:PREDICTED: transmembrane protein 17A-like isoform X1 [Struthio camelus australis]
MEIPAHRNNLFQLSMQGKLNWEARAEQSLQGWALTQSSSMGVQSTGCSSWGWLGQGCALSFVSLLQYSLLPQYYQLLLVAAFLILSLAEGFRLYLGYTGNLQEKLPLLLFLLMDNNIIRLPLETAVHILYLAFLVSEIPASFFALKAMTKQLATQFYLQQFKDGDRPQHPRQKGGGGQEVKDDTPGTVLL